MNDMTIAVSDRASLEALVKAGLASGATDETLEVAAAAQEQLEAMDMVESSESIVVDNSQTSFEEEVEESGDDARFLEQIANQLRVRGDEAQAVYFENIADALRGRYPNGQDIAPSERKSILRKAKKDGRIPEAMRVDGASIYLALGQAMTDCKKQSAIVPANVAAADEAFQNGKKAWAAMLSKLEPQWEDDRRDVVDFLHQLIAAIEGRLPLDVAIALLKDAELSVRGATSSLDVLWRGIRAALEAAVAKQAQEVWRRQ